MAHAYDITGAQKSEPNLASGWGIEEAFLEEMS